MLVNNLQDTHKRGQAGANHTQISHAASNQLAAQITYPSVAVDQVMWATATQTNKVWSVWICSRDTSTAEKAAPCRQDALVDEGLGALALPAAARGRRVLDGLLAACRGGRPGRPLAAAGSAPRWRALLLRAAHGLRHTLPGGAAAAAAQLCRLGPALPHVHVALLRHRRCAIFACDTVHDPISEEIPLAWKRPRALLLHARAFVTSR